MKSKYILKGILKSIPGIEYLYQFNKTTGGTCSARYCYAVWLRHLILAYQSGLPSVPKIVAELGPGDSLGTGLAALISGAEKYYALDVKIYSDLKINLKIFDDLVLLFKEKANLPSPEEFPEMRPLLANYDFPHYIFNDNYLNLILDEVRLSEIRNAIKTMHKPDMANKMIEYKIPWNQNTDLKNESIDLVISQAVLQDVDDLEYTYAKIWDLLKVDGVQSHDIGFKSCGSADTWYGHWEYTDIEWKIIKGRKKFYINREPYSTHHKLLRQNNFKILIEQKRFAESNVNKNKLPIKFRDITDEDLITYSVFILAKKQSPEP